MKRIFSEKYNTTIGVKTDKKSLTIGEQSVNLMVWDLAGEDEFGAVEISYLRGASGSLLVIDGTRRATLDRAVAIQQRAQKKVGDVPFLLLTNKADLAAEWELGGPDLQNLAALGWRILHTSVKNGESVETVFLILTEAMLAHK